MKKDYNLFYTIMNQMSDKDIPPRIQEVYSACCLILIKRPLKIDYYNTLLNFLDECKNNSDFINSVDFVPEDLFNFIHDKYDQGILHDGKMFCNTKSSLSNSQVETFLWFIDGLGFVLREQSNICEYVDHFHPNFVKRY